MRRLNKKSIHRKNKSKNKSSRNQHIDLYKQYVKEIEIFKGKNMEEVNKILGGNYWSYFSKIYYFFKDHFWENHFFRGFLDFFGKEIKILYFQNILVIKKII